MFFIFEQFTTYYCTPNLWVLIKFMLPKLCVIQIVFFCIPLFWVDHVDRAESLIKDGANVNEQEDEDDFAPLHYAARYGEMFTLHTLKLHNDWMNIHFLFLERIWASY